MGIHFPYHFHLDQLCPYDLGGSILSSKYIASDFWKQHFHSRHWRTGNVRAGAKRTGSISLYCFTGSSYCKRNTCGRWAGICFAYPWITAYFCCNCRNDIILHYFQKRECSSYPRGSTPQPPKWGALDIINHFDYYIITTFLCETLWILCVTLCNSV